MKHNHPCPRCKRPTMGVESNEGVTSGLCEDCHTEQGMEIAGWIRVSFWHLADSACWLDLDDTPLWALVEMPSRLVLVEAPEKRGDGEGLGSGEWPTCMRVRYAEPDGTVHEQMAEEAFVSDLLDLFEQLEDTGD